jgi:N6-L-threonylcarbamoyladenine synthase/ribosomal-protein-alanine N-acetyltransferase
MIIREATEADFPALRELVAAYQNEFWRRPFPPPALQDEWLTDGRVLVVERDGRIAGMARGELRHGLGRVSFVYLLPEHRRHGLGRALIRDLVGFFREHGAEHVTLGVDTSNQEGTAVWRRLGFTEYSREMSADLASLELRLGEGPKEESYGSVHVQTDDQNAVAAAVKRFLPRLFRSPATVVSAPRNGWVALYNEVASREPERLRRLGSELSHITGGVVLALGVEEDAVVRSIAFERGRLMDEYVSVPEYYGPLPPGDAVALRVNARVLARLTGASMDAIRRAAPTASSVAELPPPAEQLEELASILGIEGVGLGADEASRLEGAITVEHP